MSSLVVIQARCGSTRLPGKVLLPLAGRPLLQRMIERVRSCNAEFDLVVATTTESRDLAIVDLCREIGVPSFMGDPFDLLDRHYHAALAYGADTVVKIPSDCPLIDPAVIDRVLEYHHCTAARYDYVSNLHPPTYPDGNDVEVISLPALETAWREAKEQIDREHTTPFFWRHPERFRIGNVTWETGEDYSSTHRWTLDYPEDYSFIRRIYDELWRPSRPIFSIHDILGLLAAEPGLKRMNAMFTGTFWYTGRDEELNEKTGEQRRSV